MSVASSTNRGTLASWLTVEHVLYSVIVLVGSFLRFYRLDHAPLDTVEAINSWAAWLAANGLPATDGPVSQSPLFYSLQTVLFWLFGSNDGAARLIAVIAGIVLILLPWFLRPFLGRGVALLLAVLIALDPWLIVLSRVADGAMLSTTLFMLSLVGLIRLAQISSANAVYDDAARAALDRWATVISISMGLLLVSGRTSWSYLPLLVVGGVLLRPADLKFVRRSHFFWLVGAAILGATGWLAHPEGFGLISAGLTYWIEQTWHSTETLFVTGQGYPPSWVWLRLLVDQPLLSFFGIGGLVYQSRKVLHSNTEGQPAILAGNWLILLWVWLGWGLLLVSLPARDPFDLLVLEIPLLVGVAYSVVALVSNVPEEMDPREGLAVLLTLIVLIVSGVFWATALISSEQFDLSIAQAMAAILVLGIALLLIYGVWSGWRQAGWLGSVVLLALLWVVSFSSGWRVSQLDGPERPAGLYAEFTHPDVKQLVKHIQTISAQRTGDEHTIEMVVFPETSGRLVDAENGNRAEPWTRRDPVLGWYLRSMNNLRWAYRSEESTGIPVEGELLPLFLSPAEASSGETPQAISIPGDYVGSVYGVRGTWLPRFAAEGTTGDSSSSDENGWDRFRSFWETRLRPLLRWAIYQEDTQPPAVYHTILWVHDKGSD